MVIGSQKNANNEKFKITQTIKASGKKWRPS
jgi:hypothetical protein